MVLAGRMKEKASCGGRDADSEARCRHPEARSVGDLPAACSLKRRSQASPVRPQIGPIFDLDDVGAAFGPVDPKVRCVSPPPSFILKPDRYRLRCDDSARLSEADQSDEVPLQCAFMLRHPCREGLARHMGPATKRNATHIASTPYEIFAHFGISSQTRNAARRFKLLTRLDFRRLPDSRNLEH